MKINILKLKSMVLLIIICISHAISLSLKRSKDPIENINSQLNSMSTNTQIVTLILGVLSNYDPSFNSIYEELKTKDENYFTTNFGTCLTPSQSDLATAKSSNVEDVKFSLSASWDNVPQNKRKEECQKIQNDFKLYSKSEVKQGDCKGNVCQDILGYSINTVNKIVNFSLDDFSNDVSNFISDITNSSNYCEISDAKKKNLVTAKWGSYKNYQNECNLFRDMDCNDEDSVKTTSFSALVKFIKKSQTFFSYIQKVSNCFKSNNEINKLLGNKLTSLNFDVTSNLLDIFVNVITVGMWGVIKGSALILKLGILLGKIITDNTKQNAYHYGQVIGMGIRAASTLLTGTKKKK
jgi:hypothetical protein